MSEVVVGFENQIFKSNEDGSTRATLGASIPAALLAKAAIVYLVISDVDANTRVKVGWAHSADGVNWYTETASIVDTGAGSDAAKGVYVGDTGSTAFGAFLRFRISVEERVTPNSLVTCTATLHVVLKPF